MDKRSVDLDQPPDHEQEVRLESDDCRVSIWLPAPVRPMGAAIKALADAGFDVAENE